MKTFILVTDSYPYDGAREHTFLDPEVNILSSLCDLHIIPATNQGNFCANFQNVRVVENFSLNNNWFKLLFYSALCFFQKELWLAISFFILRQVRFKYVLQVIAYYYKACIFRDFLDDYIRLNKLKHVIVCSFWFSHYSFGAGMLKLNVPDLTVVTRAHGYDLYEERWDSLKIPFRRQAISFIDAIFPDSEAGLQYLGLKYPQYSTKFHVGRLGIASRNIVTQSSSDGVIRIVSCAYLVPVKRIDLLARALGVLSRRYPSQSVFWTHFGDGPERPLVESIISEIKSPKIRCIIVGEVSNNDVFTHYANNPVDFFINVSSSEGTPVSVIEAISCSIPCIVTAVGGNVEVVDNSSGVILKVNFSENQLVDEIIKAFNDRNLYSIMKNLSFLKWKKFYSAENNYKKFYDFVHSI
ncbi:MAG: glycosyltransferase [Desulfomicrobium sp.]|nr:glycosyltransferase [Desulfomicrobium sp.]